MTKGRDTTYEERIALVHEAIENGYNYTGIAQKHKVGYEQSAHGCRNTKRMEKRG